MAYFVFFQSTFKYLSIFKGTYVYDYYKIYQIVTYFCILIRIIVVFWRTYAKIQLFLNTPNQNMLYFKIRIRATKVRLVKSKIRSYLK